MMMMVHHYNGTQYCSAEKVLLIATFLETKIISQLWLSGGKKGVNLLTFLLLSLPVADPEL